MKLYFMKQFALDHLKSNMSYLYKNYYRESKNDWIYEIFEEDPFEPFIDVPDFSLMELSDKKGEMDLENCKITYTNLMRISESQASDERLWAGLCNGIFYDFVRKRWDYPHKDFKDADTDISALISRFFYAGKGIRRGFFQIL